MGNKFLNIFVFFGISCLLPYAGHAITFCAESASLWGKYFNDIPVSTRCENVGTQSMFWTLDYGVRKIMGVAECVEGSSIGCRCRIVYPYAEGSWVSISANTIGQSCAWTGDLLSCYRECPAQCAAALTQQRIVSVFNSGGYSERCK